MAGATPRYDGRLRLLGWALLFIFYTIASVVLFVLQVYSVLTLVLWIFLPLYFGLIGLVRDFAGWHRRWAGQLLGEQIPTPYLPRPAGGTFRRVRTILKDSATWRDLTWLLMTSTIGLAAFCLIVALFAAFIGGLAVPIIWYRLPASANSWIGFIHVRSQADSYGVIVEALLALGLWWWWTPPLMRGYAILTRSLLAPTEHARLTRRIEQLSESRAETVDAQAAELRRIERDLHDGAQARLVALGMSLGMADAVVQSDPEMARELIGEARQATVDALAELRQVVRGIHPPVLADRGLPGAVRALALAAPIPVQVEIDVPGRLAAPVESATYFAVAESVANVLKHAGASKMQITIDYADGRLAIRVVDDGSGGADPARGTGLSGVRHRLEAFDGTLVVISPVGGPTSVSMECPCELSSPKTLPSSGTG